MAGGRGRRDRSGRARAARRGEEAARRDAVAGSDPAETALSHGLAPWIALGAYALVTLVLFREFIFSDRMLFGSDTLSLGYMARAFFAEALRTTGFPLWNPILLGGTPFLESLAGGDSLYPPSLLLLILLEPHRALGWKLVLHVFLAGCFMHAWLRTLGVSRAGAFVGGMSYLVAPSMVTLVYPGHDGKLFVAALTPLLFWAVEWVYRRPDLRPLAAVGGAVALVILTTHFQMAYFLFGAAGAYAIFRAIQEGRGGKAGARMRAAVRLALFALFSVVGAGAAGVQLIPAVAYVTEHSRRTATTVGAEGEAGVAYSSSWSLHPEEAMGLVIPEFVGSSAGGAEWATDTYWGRNAFKLNHEYLGVVALTLGLLALLGRRGRGTRGFFVAMGAAAFLFALGAHTPIWRIAYEILPGVSLFRAPSMAIFLTAFAVSTLAGMGVDRGGELILRGNGGRVLRTAAIFLGVLVAGSVLAASGVLTGSWTSLLDPGLEGGKAEALARARPYITRGFVVAAFFAAATWGLWLARVRGVVGATTVVVGLTLLVTVDGLRVNDAFVQTLDPRAFLEPDPNVQYLMGRAEVEPPFRVFSMMQNGQDVAPGMHGLELAAGHHPNDLARYRDVIGMVGSGIPENLALFHPNVMRLLNVSYVLWPDAEYGELEGADPVSRTLLAEGVPYASVYPYPALPRARLVGEALVVGEDRTLAVILGEGGVDYDPARQTVLTEPPPLELAGGEVEGGVTWVERTPNRLVLEVSSSGPALLVLSENWFPAWMASVDGAPAPVLRADHTLRAVPIPEGTHRVEMWYESDFLRASAGVSAVCVLVLLGSVAWSLRASRRTEGSPG